MPSPFPGMDPFIESQEWDDFHPRLNARLADLISAAVEPRYVVRVERRVYVEGLDDEPLLDLQAAVSSVYDSARYQLSLDYAAPLQPELSESDAAWLRERIG